MSGDIGYSRSPVQVDKQTPGDVQSLEEQGKKENFDVTAALRAGYSRDEVKQHLDSLSLVSAGKEKNFDVEGARKAGYTDDEIRQHISTIKSTNGTDGQQFNNETNTWETPAPQVVMPSSFLDKAIGAGEAALTMGTAATGGVLGTIIGTGAAITEQIKNGITGQPQMTDKEFEDYASAPASAMTYSPRTQEGQKDVTAIGDAVAPLTYFNPALSELSTIGALGKASKVQVASDVRTAFGQDSASVAARGGYFNTAVNTKDALSKEATYLIARHPEITEEQVKDLVANVPLKDQAYAIARATDESKLVNVATEKDGRAAGYLRAKLGQEIQQFKDSVGEHDMGRVKAKYADATAMYDNKTELHDASGLVKDINNLYTIHGIVPSKAGQVARSLKAMVDDSSGIPTMSARDAVEIRPQLNAVIRKTTNGGELKKLNSIKDSLDKFIESVSTPEEKAALDSAISEYSRVAQNNEIMDIVAKNTNEAGYAVNWTAVHREIAEAKLRSPEAVSSLRIAEAFDKKFGNSRALANAALQSGSSSNGGGVLGAWGYIINGARNIVAKSEIGMGVHSNLGENLRIQQSIFKTIMKDLESSKKDFEFVDKILNDSKIPEDMRSPLSTLFNGGKPVEQSIWKDINTNTAQQIVDKLEVATDLNPQVTKSLKETLQKFEEAGVKVDVKDYTSDSMSISQATKGIGDPDVTGVTMPLDKKTNSIEVLLKTEGLSEADKSTLVAHEMLHATTNSGVNYAMTHPGTVEAQGLQGVNMLMDVIKQNANTTLKDMPVIQKAVEGKNNLLDNAKEFLSWGRSDPEVRDALMKIPVKDGNADTTVWGKILDFTAMLNDVDGNLVHTAYDELIQNGAKIMNKSTEGLNISGEFSKASPSELSAMAKLDKEYSASGGPLKPASRNGTVDKVFTSKVENKIDKSIDYSEYADAIKAYTGTSYADTNRLLRQGGQSNSKIIKFVTEAPENFSGGVYRGTRLDVDQQRILSKLTDNDVLSNASILSTSVDRTKAADFVKGETLSGKKPTMLTIVGTGHDLASRSNSGEAEVLMKPGKFFTIVDKVVTDTQVHIALKEITAAEAKGKKINKSILALPAAVALLPKNQKKEK